MIIRYKFLKQEDEQNTVLPSLNPCGFTDVAHVFSIIFRRTKKSSIVAAPISLKSFLNYQLIISAASTATYEILTSVWF